MNVPRVGWPRRAAPARTRRAGRAACADVAGVLRGGVAALGVLLAGLVGRGPAAAGQPAAAEGASTAVFEGKFIRGAGEVAFLKLLDDSWRMLEPDPELPNLAMLYEPEWNGLTEGLVWKGWWVQNSYGPTLALLPLLREPFVTFLQNSMDLWFDQMGDGQRVGAPVPYNWVGPRGCLGDFARPGEIVFKQGDGQVSLHDWALEFTAAAVVMQAEALLVSRDTNALRRYLPKLERAVAFVEERRHPANNLFRAGPAANLLGPSYAGARRPDGRFEMAYLAGLSITHIAALERMIELERLAGFPPAAAHYAGLRDSAKRALPLLTTEEGYFVKSVDPDGTRHGVVFAPKHGYFEAPPNHDAIALRVVEDAQAERIYRKIASLPGLRPHDFILPNYPGYDDMYEPDEGHWRYGYWINGGHWSSCEARMVLAYCRLGKLDDARRSVARLLELARRFRLDNPLTQFGSEVYQPDLPVHLCFDTFGPPAALLRGLLECRYDAESLTLVPRLPPGLDWLELRRPLRFGVKSVFVTLRGSGAVSAVRVAGQAWPGLAGGGVRLGYTALPNLARVEVDLGPASAQSGPVPPAPKTGAPGDHPEPPPKWAEAWQRLRAFEGKLREAGLEAAPEAAHARLAHECLRVLSERRDLLRTQALQPLPGPAQAAADKVHADTVTRLLAGLDAALRRCAKSEDARQRRLAECWAQSAE